MTPIPATEQLVLYVIGLSLAVGLLLLWELYSMPEKGGN